MATDDALTPCVSRSSAAVILTLYERSVLVFFEITIYSVHAYQYHGYCGPLCFKVSSRDIDLYERRLFSFEIVSCYISDNSYLPTPGSGT